MARASIPTLLSLDRFAQVMGINPAHFCGGAGGTVLPAGGTCQDIWWQHDWQASDRSSRESIARAIYVAEQEIASQIGYYPAPTWVESDIYRMDRPYRREGYGDGLNVMMMGQSITLRWGKLIQPGKRAVALLRANAPVVYTDADTDTYSETATVTLAPVTVPSDLCQVKAYFAGHGGEPEWEIRPPRAVTQAGGTITMSFWAWQLLNPVLQEQIPTSAPATAINLDLAGNYVAAVDVYREYNDYTQASATFYWEPTASPDACQCAGNGCAACQLTTQDGCAQVRNPDLGIVVPQPATYAEGDWGLNGYAVQRQPDLVKLHYYCGDQSQLYLKGRRCDPLSDYWAETIAWLATARLERPFCACANLTALAVDLRTDYAFTSPDGSGFATSPEDLSNPFGTRKGEIRAWKRVTQFVARRGKVAVI